MRRASASAKINLALVVGPRRDDALHEVATVLQRVDLSDRIELAPDGGNRVSGFAADTLVARALDLVSAETDEFWHATIEKRIPVAAGLGGGSSDAATALALAGAGRLRPERLHALAAELGNDVPFFLTNGPRLATGTGTDLEALSLPQDYWIVLVLPNEVKPSTAAVYAEFDSRNGGDGFDARREQLLAALRRVRRPRDLAELPPNDLASSQLADELRAAGAFRADVTGAGPAVYGLFVHGRDAHAAAAALERRGRVWVTAPAWYG